MMLSILVVIMVTMTLVNAAVPQRMLDKKNGKGTQKKINFKFYKKRELKTAVKKKLWLS